MVVIDWSWLELTGAGCNSLELVGIDWTWLELTGAGWN